MRLFLSVRARLLGRRHLVVLVVVAGAFGSFIAEFSRGFVSFGLGRRGFSWSRMALLAVDLFGLGLLVRLLRMGSR